MAFSLGTVFLEFAVKNVEAVHTALSAVQVQVTQLAAGVNAVGALASAAFNRASLSLGGWITAGVAASSVGQVMAFQMERLARTIAGVFAPELYKLLDVIGSVTNAIAGMSNAQKANIVHWIEAGAAGLVVAKVMPLVFAGISSVVGAVKTLTGAMFALDAASGGLLPLLGGMATAFAGLMVGTEIAQHGFGRLLGALQPLLNGLAEIAGSVLTAMQPAFDALGRGASQIIEAIKPLLPVLAETLGRVATVLAGVLTPILDTVGRVAAVFVSALVPILPVIARVAEVFGNVLAQALTALSPVIVQMAQTFAELAVAVVPLIGGIAELAANIGSALMPLLVDLAAVMQPVIDLIGAGMVVVVNALTAGIQALNSFLESGIGKWLALTLAINGIIGIIPSLISGFMAVVAALKAVIASQIVQLALSGPKGWLQIAAAAAIAAGAIWAANALLDENNSKVAKGSGLAAGLASAAGGKGGDGDRGALARRFGQIGSDPSEAFWRVASQSALVGGQKRPEEQMVDLQKLTNEKLDRLNQAFERQHPQVRKP